MEDQTPLVKAELPKGPTKMNCFLLGMLGGVASGLAIGWLFLGKNKPKIF